ncbi:hypothetical protein FHU33_1568 [Blastococcus colisei]|uniref:Uncharacterized protein n=1 Tax=Blastococcus colisei TaxID=1564162 RepID=A0A543PDK3_9ACTN|nr:hypothetical protein [Blastococcus colisei]TQN42174.1 hypothetical protein FHU33_1568 [Blastococcus colisei]
MTETGRPYGGTNQRPDGEGLPGEHPDNDQVGAAPEQSPRAAQGGMSDDVTHVPGGDRSAEGSDAKEPGIADATGPQG